MHHEAEYLSKMCKRARGGRARANLVETLAEFEVGSRHMTNTISCLFFLCGPEAGPHHAQLAVSARYLSSSLCVLSSPWRPWVCINNLILSSSILPYGRCRLDLRSASASAAIVEVGLDQPGMRAMQRTSVRKSRYRCCHALQRTCWVRGGIHLRWCRSRKSTYNDKHMGRPAPCESCRRRRTSLCPLCLCPLRPQSRHLPLRAPSPPRP
jgi:hypothetical protein